MSRTTRGSPLGASKLERCSAAPGRSVQAAAIEAQDAATPRAIARLHDDERDASGVSRGPGGMFLRPSADLPAALPAAQARAAAVTPRPVASGPIPAPCLSRRRALAWLAAGTLAPAVPEAVQAADTTSGPLPVVASFSILGDLVRAVGGEAVAVTELVGADADAHVYAPRPSDLRRLAGARLVVTNGLHFEGWIERTVAAAGYRGPVVVASDGIEPRRAGRSVDPHAWQSLTHARHYVRNIAQALGRALPDEAGRFEARAAEYLDRIGRLDGELRGRFGAIAPEARRVLTSHDAFGYLGEAYGIEFLAPVGWTTGSEPSAARVAQLIDQIRRLGVKLVFVENISDPRLAERIAAESGARLGGRLYSDALSKPGTEADSYLKLYAHNARLIADGLAGSASGPAAPRTTDRP